jgi:hypothetical protein
MLKYARRPSQLIDSVYLTVLFNLRSYVTLNDGRSVIVIDGFKVK